jgi:hypothetical protein
MIKKIVIQNKMYHSFKDKFFLSFKDKFFLKINIYMPFSSVYFKGFIAISNEIFYRIYKRKTFDAWGILERVLT